jgi:hypothetical protein
MLFGPKKTCDVICDQIKLNINDNDIETVSQAKDLGVIIDNDLSMSSHVSSICKRCYFALKSIYPLQYALTVQLKIKICDTLILSLINYCLIFYGSFLTKNEFYRLQKIQNLCLRYCYNVKRYEHITPYLRRSGWLNVKNRYKYYLCSIIFKIVTTKTPEYLYSRITFTKDIHDRNTRSKQLIDILKHNKEIYKSSFTYMCAKLLNKIY